MRTSQVDETFMSLLAVVSCMPNNIMFTIIRRMRVLLLSLECAYIFKTIKNIL